MLDELQHIPQILSAPGSSGTVWEKEVPPGPATMEQGQHSTKILPSSAMARQGVGQVQ